MLEIRKVSTGYGAANVVHDVDLTVGPSEIVALVGANGAGKSSLVKAISGMLPVRAGDIVLDGERLNGLSARERLLRGIAHVPEGRQVFSGLSVRENLRLGAYARGRELSDPALARAIDGIGELFPVLTGRLDEPAGNLSGGQQQMLAIARGLMAEPKILVLDEPSLGLAPVLVTEIFGFIARLREQGRSILLSEQNARLSLAIADRGYVLEQGCAVLSGSGRDLLDDPEVAERYLGVGKAVAVADTRRHDRLVSRLTRILEN